MFSAKNNMVNSFWSLKVQLNFTIIIKFPLISPFVYWADIYKVCFLKHYVRQQFLLQSGVQFPIAWWHCRNFCYVYLEYVFPFYIYLKTSFNKNFSQNKRIYVSFKHDAMWREPQQHKQMPSGISETAIQYYFPLL